MRSAMTFILFLALVIVYTCTSSSSKAYSVIMCRPGKISHLFNIGKNDVGVSIYIEGMDPLYKGVDTSHCLFEKYIKKGELRKHLMIVSGDNREYLVPRKCYNGAYILSQSMRMEWDRNGFSLMFDAYDYDTKLINTTVIAFANKKFIC